MIKRTNASFALYLQGKNYALSTVHMYCRLLDRMDIDYDISEPSQLHEHINIQLGSIEKEAAKSMVLSAKAAAARYFEMAVGDTLACFEENPIPKSPVDTILDEFLEYSTDYKKISETTAKAECRHLRVFLYRLNGKYLQDPSLITTNEIRDYVTNDLSGLKCSSAGRYITSLRNFFRFLEYKGVAVNKSVFNLPLSPADWKNGRIPVTLERVEEERIRAHDFGSDERGSRNRAITFLMLDLGLRCAEIPRIKLQDIHWNKGTLTINGSKNRYQRELPLSETSGMAIEDYVLNHRPRADYEYLFLNVKPCSNHSPVTIGTVRSVIRHLYHCEGISGWWKGTHAIRRTTASHVYNAGNGLKLTADILGHLDVKSSTHYIKVDLGSLSKAAGEWPGEVEP